MSAPSEHSPLRGFGRHVHVGVGSLLLTLASFLVLPLTQAIASGPEEDLLVRDIDTANLPPPPPPPEPEPEKQEDEPPPELQETVQPLDLSQLEMLLVPTVGGGLLAGDFAIQLGALGGKGGDVDSMFSLADLDQKPRPIVQTNPVMTPQMRKAAPATVYILLVVDERGRVENPIVQSSTDPLFEAPALAAIKQWRYEPGRRKGQPVRSRLRQPISFPKN